MEDKTPKKRPKIPFTGVKDGKSFTSENQPSPEAKKAGWEEMRAKKLLTQKIVEKLTGGKTLEEYVEALYQLATIDGNSKAIETINKGIEDQVDKSEVKHEGTAPIIIEWKKE